MKVKRSVLIIFSMVLALGIFGVMISGCEPKAPEPQEDMVIVIGTTDKVTDLDTCQAYDFYTWEIFQNISGGLLTYEPGTTDLIPGLASEWPTVSEDGKEYTFKLREGLMFTDGTPFNAEAVKYSIDRVIKIAGDPSWLVDDFVASVEVVDEYTVKFLLKDSFAYFPSLVASVPYFPVSSKVYPADKYVSDPEALVGLGAYKVESYVREVELVLVRNPDYYGSPAVNSKIVVKYYKDATTMRLAVEAGEIDIAWKTLNPTDIADLKELGELKVVEAAGAYIRYLCFVTNGDPFKEKILRQALSAAMDRTSVAEKIFLGTVDPLYSMVPIGMWSHKDSFKETWGEYNVEKAKELLAELGFNEENPFTFELWYSPSHYGDTEADMALLIKQGFEATGVMKVELKSAEWGTYTDNFDKGNMSAFLLGWYPDYIDPDNYTSPFALSTASDSMGIFYQDPKMDEFLLGAQLKTKMKERTKLYEDAQDYWATEAPTCPIFQGKLILVTQPDIEGIKVAPTMIFNYNSVYRK
jgi:peptide/nickel transport system substrate-binding protein